MVSLHEGAHLDQGKNYCVIVENWYKEQGNDLRQEIGSPKV